MNQSIPTPSAEAADNPLLQPGPAPSACRPSTGSRLSISVRRSTARSRRTRPRSRRSPPTRPSRPSPTPSTRWSAAASRSAASTACSTCSPAPTPTTRSRRSSARSRRCSPRTGTAIYLNGALFAPHRRAAWQARDARPRRRADARAGALPHALRSAPAPALDADGQGAARRDHRAARRRSAPPSARTCWPTSRPTRWCSRARPTSPACPTFVRAARAPTAEERGLHGQARHHAVALERRAVPAVLGAARPAREGLRGLDRARRRRRRRPTTRRSSPRWWRCAPSARGCSATRPSRISGSTTRWRRRRRRCATLLDRGVGAGAHARALAERDAMQDADRRPRAATSRSRAWDWRYYAEKLRKARFDVDEAEIKPYLQLDSMIEAAFDTAQPAVRPHLQAAHRRAGLASATCASGRCAAADGRHVGLFFGDYFARPSKRSGAWMTTLPRPGEARRRHPAARRQRHELRQGRRRASRRCCPSTTPARCSTSSATRCTACCPTSPIRRSPAPASLTDFVELPSQLYEHWLERPEVLRRFAVHYRDRRADAGGAAATSCSPRAPSTRASRRSNTSPRRWSISTCICSRRRRRSRRRRVREGRRSSASACRTRS